MTLYTGLFHMRIGDVRESIEIDQCSANDAIEAFRSMLGRLPHDDAFDVSERDLNTITTILQGITIPQLTPVNGKQYVWYWLEGARMDDPIDAYIIATATK